ncbi:MAG: cytochrome d ubiquinol oxidase subunit II [Planctomycetes bacterium]|nr:cytochrome d ubiquinol oxidase subunit II [Planctomycetota bacterium]
MFLNSLWFVLIAILYIGYFVLEGFDLGVGILLPFLGRNDTQRRIILNTIGPHWDGNEVWLITAGGATFAAFPIWYATLFSGFYMPLFLILIALIVRGVAFEFRSKIEDMRWRKTWDWTIFGSSLVLGLLWGVAFANFVLGVPIDATLNYVGGFWNLLNPYALLGGVVSLCGFILHGAVFLSLKTSGSLMVSARRAAWGMWIPTMLFLVIFSIYSYFALDLVDTLGVNPGIIPIGAVTGLLLAGYFIRVNRDGWAFSMTATAIALATGTIFLTLYPRLLVSNLNPDWSLTIFNSASGSYTLGVMSIVVLIFVPVVLAYQAWTYWVFRKRITEKPEKLEY